MSVPVIVHEQTKADAAPVEALCERVRALARRSGEETLLTRQQESAKVVAESRQRVEAECQAEQLQARKRLDQQVKREIQNARLEARARLARFRWSLLDAILEEAVHTVLQMRDTDSARYRAALVRFFQEARQLLTGSRLVVQVNPQDFPALQLLLSQATGSPSSDEAPDLVEAPDIDAGLRVGTLQGEVVSDQSLALRRERRDQELRLAITAILWGSELKRSAETEVPA